MADNCFVCTLGQAQKYDKPGAGNIPEFLEKQARGRGRIAAVGFADLEDKSATVLLSFNQLNELSKGAARKLICQVPYLREFLGEGRTVALLAHSNIHFLEHWLALIRLGFSVLILASQLDKTSAKHLCTEEQVEYVFHDSDHEGKARELQGLALVNIDLDEILGEGGEDVGLETQLGPHGRIPAVSFLHHSSGTSSGKPKAIPQSNSGAFAALPFIEHSLPAATFSSTPLSQAGGTADCLRAWTSAQMIWLFPAGSKPITAQNVLKCLAAADECTLRISAPPVKYFSSVPYVLHDLAESEQGSARLRTMDIVGVGGAALPTSLGKQLVDQGLNLVSRYGSAECGFLLSSYRDFQKDKHWDYLRSGSGAKDLSFEPQTNNLFELVVKPGWPQVARTNRADGSYATADLFERHPTMPNAWRYHSRADAQIALASGKKFDPVPIEAGLLSRCKSDPVLDVLIFGDGETHPGALIFVTDTGVESSSELLERVWPKANEINQQSPSYARLSKHMLKVMTPENGKAPSLEKSAKGTVIRTKAVERYRHHIRQMYGSASVSDGAWKSINEKSDLVGAIIRIVEDTTARRLTKDDDFFEHGIDSVASVQIVNAIQALLARIKQHVNQKRSCEKLLNGQQLLQSLSEINKLRPNLLYDCATIGNLADFLLGHEVVLENDVRLMNRLLPKHSQFDMPAVSGNVTSRRYGEGMVVLLTGATGALGTHLLDQLRSHKEVRRIYCLVRAQDSSAAHQRVDKALKSRAKRGLATTNPFNEKIICVPCKLSQSDLGLGSSMLGVIRSTVDLMLHPAWAVNFTLRLKSFESHLAGMRNLLNLGFAAAECSTRAPLSDQISRKPRVKFAFCSSIASVSSHDSSSVVNESISRNPGDASPLGYSRSKWVAEAICNNAQKVARETGLPLLVDILRIGQLCGDSQHGIWNKTEAWPLMLSSYDVAGCIPDLSGEALNWLPLDVAAKAICEVSFNHRGEENPREDPVVYHILNPNSTPTWTQMLEWLQESEIHGLQVAQPATWLEKLEDGLKRDGRDHPCGKLLGLWKDAYLHSSENGRQKPVFATAEASKASPIMHSVEPLSRSLVEQMWMWVRESISRSVDNSGS